MSSVDLSKKLSKTLRHNIQIGIQSDGFISVATLLKQPMFKGYTADDIRECVDTNNKQRFTLQDDMIRANQGHSISVPDLELELLSETFFDNVKLIHGTYRHAWDLIEIQGLSKMGRNHIHFTTKIPSEGQVISGMRHSCNVFVYVDAVRAIRDGYKFYKSSNGVILCPGNLSGFIPSFYICNVIFRD